MLGHTLNMTLSQGEQWRGVVSAVSGNAPLIVDVHVKNAHSCAEGAAADGTCIFGLKLLGSSIPHGPFEQIDEHQHTAGKPYELIVSSCMLRRHQRGEPPVTDYHVSLLGWDGISELTLATKQRQLPMLRPYCPVETDAHPPPLQAHAAVLVDASARWSKVSTTDGPLGGFKGESGTMLVFGGNLRHDVVHGTATFMSQSDPEVEAVGISGRRLDSVSLQSSLHRPTAELWALDIGKRIWRRLGPPPGVRKGGADTTLDQAGADATGGGATWPAARSAHTMTRSSNGDIYLFGGRTNDTIVEDNGPEGKVGVPSVLNDVWVLGYAAAEHAATLLLSANASGNSVAPAIRWRQLLPIGAAPPRRRYHAAATVTVPGEGESLIILGGLSELSPHEEGGEAPAVDAPGSIARGVGLRGAVVLLDVWRLPLSGARGDGPLADAAAYGDGTVTWQPHATMRVVNPRERSEQPAERYGHSACGWHGVVFVYGGISRSSTGGPVGSLGVSADLWELRLDGRGQWVRVQSRIAPIGRAFHTASVVGDVMLVYGGVDAQGHTLNDLWALHLPDRTWALLRPHDTSRLGPFVGRSRHSAVPLPPPATDVLIFGGLSGYTSLGTGPRVSVSEEALLKVKPPNCAASPGPSRRDQSFAQQRATTLRTVTRGHASSVDDRRRRMQEDGTRPLTVDEVGFFGAESTAGAQLDKGAFLPDPSASQSDAASFLALDDWTVSAAFAAGHGCVPCLPGTRAIGLPIASSSDNFSQPQSETTCEPCEAGWLSLTSGAGACSPCPAGTYSPFPGASSWRECRLCPAGTFSREPGSAQCTPCDAAIGGVGGVGGVGGGPHPPVLCPAGSAMPAPVLLPGGSLRGSVDAGSSFFGIASEMYPKAMSSYTSTDRSLATAQLIITFLGGVMFFLFLVFLGISAVFRPKMTEKLLRTADVPPISGGPGNSRAGGLFTIAYAFFYSAFAFAFVLQFIFFNERTSASLIPAPSEHFATTPITIRLSALVAGYAAEMCTAPGVPAGIAGQCAEGIGIESNGMHIPFGGGVNTSCTLHMPSPTAARAGAFTPPNSGPSCSMAFECVECNVASAEAQLHVSLAGRFAYAHRIDWEASTAWSKSSPIPGRSSLRASILPSEGNILRGDRPSVVTLALVPTVYENNINNTQARGFQLQYLATALGATVDPGAFDPEALAEGGVELVVRLQPLAQEYKLTVALVRTLVELIASLMALGSGFSFVCRFALWFYLKTMHGAASKFGSKVHAGVLRGSLAVRGGPEERKLRYDRRGAKARIDRHRSDGLLLKRYWSHSDGVGRRDGNVRASSASEESLAQEEGSFRVVPTATAAPWLWSQANSESLWLPGLGKNLLRKVSSGGGGSRRGGFMRLVDEVSDTDGGKSVASPSLVMPGVSKHGEGSGIGGSLAEESGEALSVDSGTLSPAAKLVRRQRSAGMVSQRGPSSSARRRHRRAISHGEAMGSLLRDAHHELQHRSVKSAALDAPFASTYGAPLPQPNFDVPAVYSYGEGSTQASEGGRRASASTRPDHVAVSMPDPSSNVRHDAHTLFGEGYPALTISIPSFGSVHQSDGDVEKEQLPGQGGALSDDGTTSPKRSSRSHRDGSEAPLTPPHGHPHYTVIAGIQSP